MNPLQCNLGDYFGVQIEAIREGTRQVARKPSKHAVHKLRVAIRRTRSILWILRHSACPLKLKELNQNLRKLSRKLGDVRDLDIAIKDCKIYGLEFARLKSQRKSYGEDITRRLQTKRQGKIERQLSEALEYVRTVPIDDFDQGLNQLRVDLMRWRRRSIGGESSLHRFRIVIKKARYVSEAIGKPTQPLIELQDILGKVHDLEVLRVLAKDAKGLRTEREQFQRKAKDLAGAALKQAVHNLDGSDENSVLK